MGPRSQKRNRWDQYEMENLPPLPSSSGNPDNAPDPNGPLLDHHLALYMQGVRPDKYQPAPGDKPMFDNPARVLMEAILGGRRPQADPSIADGGLNGILRDFQNAKAYNQFVQNPLSNEPGAISHPRSSFGITSDIPEVSQDAGIQQAAIDRAEHLAQLQEQAQRFTQPQVPPRSLSPEIGPSVERIIAPPAPTPAPITGEFGRTGQYLASQGGVGGFRGADLQVGTPMERASKQMGIQNQVRRELIPPQPANFGMDNGVRSFGTPEELAANAASRQAAGNFIAENDRRVQGWNDLVAGEEKNVATQAANNEALLDGIRTGATAERQLRQGDINSGITRDGHAIPRGWEPGAPVTQRVGLVAPPGAPNPFPNSPNQPTPRPLTEQMADLGNARAAQRERLVEQGKNPAVYMGNPAAGRPDISRLAAVSNTLQRSGLNPRIAMGMATMGDPAFANRELLNGLLGVNQQDPRAVAEARDLNAGAALKERQLQDYVRPGSIEQAKREQETTDAKSNLRRGAIDYNPVMPGIDQKLESGAVMTGSAPSPSLLGKILDDYRSRTIGYSLDSTLGDWGDLDNATLEAYRRAHLPDLDPEAFKRIWFGYALPQIQQEMQDQGSHEGFMGWPFLTNPREAEKKQYAPNALPSAIRLPDPKMGPITAPRR